MDLSLISKKLSAANFDTDKLFLCQPQFEQAKADYCIRPLAGADGSLVKSLS